MSAAPQAPATAALGAPDAAAGAASPPPPPAPRPQPGALLVRAQSLRLAHEGRLVQRDIGFDLHAGEVLAITGGSGSGKSTLLRHLIGLQTPAAGQVLVADAQGRLQDLHRAEAEQAQALRQRFGVMFQSGALWSSMSVLDNLTLPLELFSGLSASEREAKARERLAAVGLGGQERLNPAELSGGMRKRVALARAMMLDAPLLYLDEPAAGLDPVNAARLDKLILRLSRTEGRAVVMVTHDIPSVFAVADRMLYLDADAKTMTALDRPAQLLAHGPEPVREFLQAGLEARAADDALPLRASAEAEDNLPEAPVRRPPSVLARLKGWRR